ncbi:VOC family protein [Blastococcus sp. Marseille-P5729]|uniref:VOC family protein n=1 Tax=Blastococcus sp. Marseille-P5729 TaxID=2086582 RepID=UPI000D0E4375|nr:VOC family protein [Blastococcus sp. Marseille-P5729]
MRMRLRQVALVAADLEPVEAEITEKLGLELCFRDPGVGEFGLHNALFPVGDKFLEVVSPNEEGTTAGRLLDKRNGDGGYMVILQVDDLADFSDRFGEHEVRIVYTAEGPGITGIHLHPRDIGGAILSVDSTDDWQDWGWAGPDWRDKVSTELVADLLGVTIQAADPESMARRWATVLDRALVEDTDGHRVELDEGVIRFVADADGRGDGLTAIDLRAADGQARTEVICGTTVNLVP